MLPIYLLLATSTVSADGWSWICDQNDGYCTRTLDSSPTTSFPSQETCKMTCGHYGILWPQPTGNTTLGKQLIKFPPGSITVNNRKVSSTILDDMIKYFRNKLPTVSILNCKSTFSLIVNLDVNSDDSNLRWITDESYKLESAVQEKQIVVTITAETVFGARHGLETLLQLIEPFTDVYGENCLVTLNEAHVEDNPVYRHRGLLIDTGRNFLSLDSIRTNIDGLAASKMNVLHWHITDSQSFPLELPSLPNMTLYGAYSPEKVYRPNDIKDLVYYAKVRGVRIILEVDGPSHAGNGWQWAPEAGLGNLSVCINQQPWRSFCIQPPCGQLNPVNPNVFKVLTTLFKDVAELIPDSETYHMGGDEVFIPCWNNTDEIINSLQGKPRTEETFINLWSDYQKNVLNSYDSAVGHKNSSVIVWTSTITDPSIIEKHLSKDRYIIHTWVPVAQNSLLESLLKLGYRLIISTKDKWYLDHGFWGSTAYHNWRNVYENKILLENGVLGGEVCMWGELVEDTNVEPRIWPRAAAAAERLWSNPNTNSHAAQPRFFLHRDRLVQRGIRAEAVTPRYCVQNDGDCDTYLRR